MTASLGPMARRADKHANAAPDAAQHIADALAEGGLTAAPGPLRPPAATSRPPGNETDEEATAPPGVADSVRLAVRQACACGDERPHLATPGCDDSPCAVIDPSLRHLPPATARNLQSGFAEVQGRRACPCGHDDDARHSWPRPCLLGGPPPEGGGQPCAFEHTIGTGEWAGRCQACHWRVTALADVDGDLAVITAGPARAGASVLHATQADQDAFRARAAARPGAFLTAPSPPPRHTALPPGTRLGPLHPCRTPAPPRITEWHAPFPAETGPHPAMTRWHRVLDHAAAVLTAINSHAAGGGRLPVALEFTRRDGRWVITGGTEAEREAFAAALNSYGGDPPATAGRIEIIPPGMPGAAWREDTYGPGPAGLPGFRGGRIPPGRRITDQEDALAYALQTYGGYDERDGYGEYEHDEIVRWRRAAGAEHTALAEADFAAQARNPGALARLDGDAALTVAAGPGTHYAAWGHAAVGVWYAPAGEPTEDLTAEQMTAAALRALLAARDAYQPPAPEAPEPPW